MASGAARATADVNADALVKAIAADFLRARPAQHGVTEAVIAGAPP
jgi:hypothetical protein